MAGDEDGGKDLQIDIETHGEDGQQHREAILDGFSDDFSPGHKTCVFPRAEGEKSPAITDDLAMETMTVGIGETVDAIGTQKDSILAGNEETLVRRPLLGFGGASSKPYNGGHLEEPLNIDEFLHLAHAVVDDGDEKALVALKDIKTKWAARFGERPALRGSFESFQVGNAPPHLGDLRQVWRRLLPSVPLVSSSENATQQTALQQTVFAAPTIDFSRFSEGIMTVSDFSPASGGPNVVAPVVGGQTTSSPVPGLKPSTGDMAALHEVECDMASDKEGDVASEMDAHVTVDVIFIASDADVIADVGIPK
ncbi:UNVERIFIED_CONTAM: hypothetical protein Sindi_1311800 [Sesamum indicum]